MPEQNPVTRTALVDALGLCFDSRDQALIVADVILGQFTVLHPAPVAVPPKKFCGALAEGSRGETYECHRLPNHEERHDWDHTPKETNNDR